MTVATSSGGAVTPWGGGNGLEDFDTTDMSVPRLSFNHTDGKIKDSLSGIEYDQLDVIMLGLVKQRAMFDAEVADGQVPQCKSPDFGNGFPTLSADRPEDIFPWADSNFTEQHLAQVDFTQQSSPAFPDSLPHLACGACKFKEWGSKPGAGPKSPPRCNERYTFPLYYNAAFEGEPEEWTAAILSLQKTGLAPAKKYISSFARSNKALFQVMTRITLDKLRKGNTRYVVPIFTNLGATDASMWNSYYEEYTSMRQFTQTWPEERGLSEDATPPAAGGNVNAGPVTPAPQATPAAAQPAPVVTPAPAAAPAPVVTPEPTPAPQVAPAAAPAAPVQDASDLPF